MSHQHHHPHHHHKRVCETHPTSATTGTTPPPTAADNGPPFNPTTLRLDHLPVPACASWGISLPPGSRASPHHPLWPARAALYTPAVAACSAFLTDPPGLNVLTNLTSESQGRGLHGYDSLGAAFLGYRPDSDELSNVINTQAQVSQALGAGRWTASGWPPLKALGPGPVRQIVNHRPWEDAVNSSPAGSSDSESAGAPAYDDSFLNPCWWPQPPSPPPCLRPALRQPKRFRPILVYPPVETEPHVQHQHSGHYRRLNSDHHPRPDRIGQAADRCCASCCSPVHSGICCNSPTCWRYQIEDDIKTSFSRQYWDKARNCCRTHLRTCCITSCDLCDKSFLSSSSPGERSSGANSISCYSESPRRYYEDIDKPELRHLSSWTQSSVCEASTPVFTRRPSRFYQMKSPRTSTSGQSMKNGRVHPKYSVEDLSWQRDSPLLMLPEMSSTSYHQQSRGPSDREVLSVPTFSLTPPVPPLPAPLMSSPTASTSRRHLVSGRLGLTQQNSVPESRRRDNRRQEMSLQSLQVPCHSISQESFLLTPQNVSSNQSCLPRGSFGRSNTISDRPLANFRNQMPSPTGSNHQPFAGPIVSQSTMYADSSIKDLSIHLSTNAPEATSTREQASVGSQISLAIHGQTSLSLGGSGSGVSPTKNSQFHHCSIPLVSDNAIVNASIDKPVTLFSHPNHSSAYQISISNCQPGEALSPEAPGGSVEKVNLFSTAPKRAGPESPKAAGLGSPKRVDLGSPKRADLGSPKRAGLGSPKRADLGSPKRAGPERKCVRGRRFSCADFDISVLDFEDLLTPRINPAQLSTQSMIDLSHLAVDCPHTPPGHGTSSPSQYQRPLPGVNKCPRLLNAASVPNLQTPATSLTTQHFWVNSANKAFKPPETMGVSVTAETLASLSASTEVSLMGNVQQTICEAARESSCPSDSVPVASSPLSAHPLALSSLPLTLSSADITSAPKTSSPVAVSTQHFTDPGSALSEAPVTSPVEGEEWLDYTHSYGSFLQLLHTPDLPPDGATFRPLSTRTASRPPSRQFLAKRVLSQSTKDLLANRHTFSPQLKVPSLDASSIKCFDQPLAPLAVPQYQQTTAAQTTQEGDETESRRHKCPFCGLACTNHGQLKGHLRVHTGERPYRCQCGRAFARNEELTRHRRIHLGLRPFCCTVCSKSFGRKDHLTKHEKTHLGRSEKKVHTCAVLSCGQSYTRSDALARHQWSCHGIRPRTARRCPLGQDRASH